MLYVFEDVCTINELLSLSQRFEVAKMLTDKRTYLDISEKTGASTATISWQEGVSGYGINESVSFSFDDLHKVKYIAFKLGNWKNDKYYYGNAKPKTINLVFGD